MTCSRVCVLQSASLRAAFEHDPLLPGREYAGPAAALPYSDRHPGTWHHDPEVRQAEACGLPGCGQAAIKFPLTYSTHDTIIANCSCTTKQQSSAPRGGWSGSSPSACSASCCWSSPSRDLQAIRKLARHLRGGNLVRTGPRELLPFATSLGRTPYLQRAGYAHLFSEGYWPGKCALPRPTRN